MTHPLRAEIAELEQLLASKGAERDALIVEAVQWDQLTYRQAAEVYGVSCARVGQIMARALKRQGELKDFTPAQRASRARDAFESARHAQDLACEAAGGVNERERKAFYGSIHESAMDGAERRIGVNVWRELHALGRVEEAS